MIGLQFSSLNPTAYAASKPALSQSTAMPSSLTGLVQDEVQFGKTRSKATTKATTTKTQNTDKTHWALEGATLLKEKAGSFPVYVKGDNIPDDIGKTVALADEWIVQNKKLGDQGFWVQIERSKGDDEFIIVILKEGHKNPFWGAVTPEKNLRANIADIVAALRQDPAYWDVKK